MIPHTELFIRLIPGRLKPRVGEHRLNVVHGGPETLLNWLETQLGLCAPSSEFSSRVTEYLNALEKPSEPLFESSLQADRWATGVRLLQLRDELKLAGWTEEDNESLPQLVRDLARTATEHTAIQLGEAERLSRVLSALSEQQTLPPHRCVLSDPLEAWPLAWRSILEHLSIEINEEVSQHAAQGTTLRSAQEIVCGGDLESLVPDTSFRYLSTRSETTACEFIAHTLARAPEFLSQTIIYCEDDGLAMRLDACLNRFGLPTMGAAKVSPTQPVMQVLPLSLSLLWEPVDPQLLLDFLTLPISPIPRNPAFQLAESLAKQPGLGSEKWDETLIALCSPENDPEQKLSTRLSAWLLNDRVSKGQTASTSDVRKRCNLVAQWAASRAQKMSEDDDSCEELIEALKAAATHASLLGELVEIQGDDISEPQLSRLLEETLGGGVETTATCEDANGPIRVRSLGEINSSCKTLVWLGLGTADASMPHWSNSDRSALNEIGIAIDDGSNLVSALRRIEARGFSFVEESLLAVLIPSDTTRRWHPLWLAIRNALGEDNEPLRLEDAIASGSLVGLEPFGADVVTNQIEPPPRERALWTAPEGVLQDRTNTSATELQVRLACPLKWTLLYQAKLRPSVIAQLPSSFLLKGSFCHSVLQRVFGDGGTLPSANEAERLITDAFNERLPLDAAPLAQPNMAGEKRRLRQELCNATRTLINALATGGYQIVGIEEKVEATAHNKELIGSIDCLAKGSDETEAVIDFKYAGRKKYQALLSDGRAVQLATYAHARSQDSDANGRYPEVAYLILAEGQLFTLAGSPLIATASTAVDGADIETVWNRFSTAIEQANDWLESTNVIPARPLQQPVDWPNGADLVLETDLPQDRHHEVCRYCDFSTLCGLRRLT